MFAWKDGEDMVRGPSVTFREAVQFVHYGGIADPPEIVNTGRSIVNFSLVKSNRWFI